MTGTVDSRCWQPLEPAEAVAALAEADLPWWIGGGHAVDHVLGHVSRAHSDLDVVIPRARLSDWIQYVGARWDVWVCAWPTPLRRLADIGGRIGSDARSLWLSDHGQGPFRFEMSFHPIEADVWRYPQAPDIARQLPTPSTRTDAAFLPPEVVLLLKADKADRAKHRKDFTALLDHLDHHDRAWLGAALVAVHGAGHPWCVALSPPAVPGQLVEPA